VAAPAVIVEASLRLHLEHTRQRVPRLVHHGVHHGGAPAHQDSGDQASFRFHSLRFQVDAPDQNGDQPLKSFRTGVSPKPRAAAISTVRIPPSSISGSAMRNSSTSCPIEKSGLGLLTEPPHRSVRDARRGTRAHSQIIVVVEQPHARPTQVGAHHTAGRARWTSSPRSRSPAGPRSGAPGAG
jgi:hypothetical protein